VLIVYFFRISQFATAKAYEFDSHRSISNRDEKALATGWDVQGHRYVKRREAIWEGRLPPSRHCDVMSIVHCCSVGSSAVPISGISIR